jgi:hypothetical protein
MIALFIISSPFQALNVVSAIKRFQIKKWEIIITNTTKEAKAIIDVLNEFNINNYSIFENHGLLYYYLLRYRKIIGSTTFKYNGIFIGDFEDITHICLLNYFSNEKTNRYILDDGNKTILGYLNSFRISKMLYLRSTNWKVKYTILSLVINQRRLFKNAIVYSIFTPNNKITQTFIFNDLSKLVNNHIQKEAKQAVCIIGSPYVNMGVISESRYIEMLNNIKLNHKDLTFYYIPHRKESKKFILSLKDIGIVGVENNTSIEVLFMFSNWGPRFVYGFGSTALFSLSNILGATKFINLGFVYSSEEPKLIMKEYNLIIDYYNRTRISNIKE